MPSLINRTLTEHRGSPRIYLDDAILDELEVDSENPFYDRIWQDDKLILRLNPNGKYKISSKAKNSSRVHVIDINLAKLSELFDLNSKLRIAIKKGSIIIKRHAIESAIKLRESSFLEALSQNKLTMASLCHGGGLLDHAMHSGFKKADISTSVSFAVEIDDRYLNSSIRNNPHLFNDQSVYINSDIADVNPHNMTQVNVLTAGLPCTGASLSGKSKNKLSFAEEHESAGACFFSFLNIVKGCGAALVVLENVKQYIGTASFAVIKSVLGSLGFDLLTDVYVGTDFGATERRERMVCLALSKGLNKSNVLSSISEHLEGLKTPSTPIADILDDVPLDHPSWKEVEYLKLKEEKDRNLGKGFRMQLLEPSAESCGVLGAGYAKARSTEARMLHPINKALSRLFNKREHARIKKAPESIVDGLSETVAHQILGNGVIVSLFEALAYSIGVVAKRQLPLTVRPAA